MVLILVLFVIAAAIGVIIITLDWITHISMVRSNSESHGWASFRTFKEQFQKVDWTYDKNRKSSLFGAEWRRGKSYKDEYFANIIKFNYNGMVLNNPLSFFMTKIYVKDYIKKNGLQQPNVKEWYKD